MILLFLNIFRVKWIRTGRFFSIFAALIVRIAKYRNINFQTNLDFFQESNSFPNGRIRRNLNNNVDADVVFVATEKDFPVLIHAIRNAIRVTRNFNTANIFIVVPDESVSTAQEMYSAEGRICVIPESKIVSRDILTSLRDTFGIRANWIYQQLLKVEFIRQSDEPYCLIIDADTVLLKSRSWLDSNSRIGITPTDESNPDYHSFLRSIGVISENPSVSFVPHHMFYDVEDFKTLTQSIGFNTPESTVLELEKHINKSSASPLSIDYELYGQWMYSQNPDKANFIKWANIGIRRKHANRVLN